MSPPPATVLSPESLNLSHQDQQRKEPDDISTHTPSPSSDTVNVKTHPDVDSAHADEDGGQRPDHSGDDGGSDQDHDNDDDVFEVVNRHGKRKRPISVSYVRLVSWSLMFYSLFKSNALLILSFFLFLPCWLVASLEAHIHTPRKRKGVSQVWLGVSSFPQICPCHRYQPIALASGLPQIFIPALLRLAGSHNSTFVPSGDHVTSLSFLHPPIRFLPMQNIQWLHVLKHPQLSLRMSA